jgi:GGDEF domain-containing protein
MTKTEMQAMIERLSNDPIWSCYTRAALQERWEEFSNGAVGIAYCDIDDMHGLNSKHGHAGVDAMIRQVVGNIRHDDVVISRWLNGDELVFIIKSGDVELFCHRIQSELNLHGINGTFAFSTWILDDPFTTINPLDAKVNRSKNNGVRGVVLS